MWWPWRKRARQGEVAEVAEVADVAAPTRYFISHAYQDETARAALAQRLPAGMTPFIFPRIVVPPQQMVSDRLLDAIRGCAGLIYLLGGMSARSFWVALERDYALRMGKPVFAYDPATGALTRDDSAPLTLNAVISSAHADRDREAGERLGEALRRRYFSPLDTPPLRSGELFDGVLERMVEQIIASGCYAIALWSAQAQAAASHSTDAERRTTKEASLWRDRVVYGVLDRTPVPPANWKVEAVQLYGDAERSATQRLDDLIVRLYWLIYRNTRQNALN